MKSVYYVRSKFVASITVDVLKRVENVVVRLQCFPSYRLLFNPRANSWQVLWSLMNCLLLKTMQLTCIAPATTVGEDHMEPIKDMGLLSHAQNTTALQPDVFLNAIHRLVATNERQSPFCSANYC